MADMRRMTEAVVCKAAKFGVKVNTRKTEFMKIRIDDASNVFIEDESIQEEEGFVYLGYEVRKDGDIRKEVGITIDKAGAAFKNMERVWNKNGVCLRTKLKLFNSIVPSGLLYGCEALKGLK